MAQAAQDGGAAEEEVDSVGAERQEAAELATLPDEAYIRTRATGDSDDSSDGDDDGDISDDDEDDEDGADSAHEDMSDIVETQINDTQLDEPTTQVRTIYLPLKMALPYHDIEECAACRGTIEATPTLNTATACMVACLLFKCVMGHLLRDP